MSLISIVVLLVVCGLVYYLITLLPLPAPFPLIIKVVVIIALILVLLDYTGVLGGGIGCGSGLRLR